MHAWLLLSTGKLPSVTLAKHDITVRAIVGHLDGALAAMSPFRSAFQQPCSAETPNFKSWCAPILNPDVP